MKKKTEPKNSSISFTLNGKNVTAETFSFHGVQNGGYRYVE